MHYLKEEFRSQDFDAVIPRIGASVTFYGCAMVRQFEMMGVYSLNESVAITRARDKLRSLQLLARKGVGIPVTSVRPYTGQCPWFDPRGRWFAAGNQATGRHSGQGRGAC